MERLQQIKSLSQLMSFVVEAAILSFKVEEAHINRD